jgi:hypothetical protein
MDASQAFSAGELRHDAQLLLLLRLGDHIVCR